MRNDRWKRGIYPQERSLQGAKKFSHNALRAGKMLRYVEAILDSVACCVSYPALRVLKNSAAGEYQTYCKDFIGDRVLQLFEVLRLAPELVRQAGIFKRPERGQAEESGNNRERNAGETGNGGGRYAEIPFRNRHVR